MGHFEDHRICGCRRCQKKTQKNDQYEHGTLSHFLLLEW
jgi:hypothetical protein